MQTSAPDGVSRTSRMHAVTAAVAWFGVVLVGVLSATGSFAAPEQIEGTCSGATRPALPGCFDPKLIGAELPAARMIVG